MVERVGSTSQPLVCECCNGCHILRKCASFEAKTVEQRRALLEESYVSTACFLDTGCPNVGLRYSRGQKCRTTLSNSDENTITLIHSLIKKDIGLIKKDIGKLR